MIYKYWTTREASSVNLKPFRHIIGIVCIVASLITNADEPLTAKGPANQSTTAELQLLQGKWEGAMAGDQGTSKSPDDRKPSQIGTDFFKPGVFVSAPKPRETITITITGNSLHFHRDTNFWFDTTITLPAGTDPKQLHATIKACPPSQAESIGKVVRAIFKIEDGTLTLATIGEDDETPKSFEATEDKGQARYELRKVQPRKEITELPKSK